MKILQDKKSIGSFYTPETLTDFIIKYLAKRTKDQSSLNILEPSIGEGQFLKSIIASEFNSAGRVIDFCGVELIAEELNKAKDLIKNIRNSNFNVSFHNSDFLCLKNTSLYSLIIGNPPYVKKNFLTKKQIAKAENIFSQSGISKKSFKNLWAAFLIKCSNLLKPNGILSFVLPLELLQVKFASEIRDFLISNFERTEVFTFDKSFFGTIGQDTILLFCYKKAAFKGQYYCHVKEHKSLINHNFKLIKNDSITKFNTKWSHHSLQSSDLEFLHGLEKHVTQIKDYCYSVPGMVTAANAFFIVAENTAKKYGLEKYLKPIIPRAMFVNGSVVFDEKDYAQLINSGKPNGVLCLSENDSINGDKRLFSYLEKGKNLNINIRYKCRERKKWYVIPNVNQPSDAFFFKRSYHYPKFLKNEAKVYVTDSAYKINMKQGYHINSLIFSFYNSLTLCFSEINGRYYSGGVLELTPKEFKQIPIPYHEINNMEFDNFREKFENKKSISEILDKNDQLILGTTLGLNTKDLIRIQKIREKLLQKRLKI